MHEAFRHAFDRPISWFFLFVCVAIVTTMMVPAAFGLQHFTQWGGMYSNSWCRIQIADRDPLTESDAQVAEVTAGFVTQAVWSYPMHNRSTCAVWGRKYCGKPSPQGGWTVEWVRPYFKDEYYMDPENVCTVPMPASYSSWFQDVTK
ncbi:MAG: hypothetical protein ABL890_04780 [Candidatus Peribacteraceae bacterium]